MTAAEPIKLCTTCAFYRGGDSEDLDTCTHAQAEYGGVRQVKLYSCRAMRVGLCRGAQLHEAKLSEAA